jgi:MerR family redox-sensitive transcriptional activator SoxR
MPSHMTHPALPIGVLAKRSGVAASALRFYETQGLIKSARSPGGRRIFTRDALRRVAFIRVAQSVGLTLEDIRAALEGLPNQRTPTRSDWVRLSAAWRPLLDSRINCLIRLRDRLFLVYRLRLPVPEELRTLQSERQRAIARQRPALFTWRRAALCRQVSTLQTRQIARRRDLAGSSGY